MYSFLGPLGAFGGENPKQAVKFKNLSSQILCISFHIFSYMELPLTEYSLNVLFPYFKIVHLRSSHMRVLGAYFYRSLHICVRVFFLKTDHFKTEVSR